MKKNLIFAGVATALITPFRNGEIDFTSLGNIIEFQIASGINALVIAGTTGESSTLTEKERYRLYEYTIDEISGRVPVILGTGTNNTAESIKYTKQAKELGADAALVVTPYYNKGTEAGIIEHYKSIANNADMPIILYNVPARTGVNLPLDAIEKLSEEENIVAIKEASGSLDRLISLSLLKDKLTLYSGNDSEIYPTLSLSGMGVISVLSNIDPCEVLYITERYFAGDTAASLKKQQQLLPKISALFRETNPAPIKYAMSKRGLCSPDVRLPLTQPSEGCRKLLDIFFK